MADDAPAPPSLTIPATLDPVHAAILREHRFESAGTLAEVLGDDEYQGVRVLYALCNPAATGVVYVGDSEQGRDLYGRLKAHANDRSKMGHVELNSLVFVHVLVTEYMVLRRFEEDTGKLPLLNRTKTQKHARKGMRINGRERLAEDAGDDGEREAPRGGERPEIRLLNPPKGQPRPEPEELTLKQERKRWKRDRKRAKREGALMLKPRKGTRDADECIRLFGRRRKTPHIVLLN